MPKDGRRGVGSSVLFIIAFCASFAVILAIMLNWVKWEPLAYQLTGSISEKAADTPFPK
jgi:hypothetical protein